jgi:hypothetical protein
VIDSVNENAALAIGIGAPNRWPEYADVEMSKIDVTRYAGKGVHVSRF